MALYRLFVPKQAVGASLIYFDLFATTGPLTVLSVVPVVSGAVAVTGIVGVDLFLNRTSAVGTGGTAATYEGTSQTATTISAHNHTQLLTSAFVTARITPSGGATAGAVLGWASVFSEETNSGTYNAYADMARGFYDQLPGIVVREGTGIAVTQGSVASVGNIGFNVIFDK